MFDDETNTILYDGHEYKIHEESSSALYFNYLMSFICLFGCGYSAGVGIGFLSLDSLNVELLGINGTPEEKECIKVIQPIIEKHHLLLSAMLILNAISVE